MVSSIYLFYDPKDGKLHFGPLWDYDLSFGNINYNDCDKTDGFYIQVRGVWFARLFTDPAFCKKVKDRWNQKKSAVYKSIETQINILYEIVKSLDTIILSVGLFLVNMFGQMQMDMKKDFPLEAKLSILKTGVMKDTSG